MPAIAEDYNNYLAFTLPTESLGPIRIWKFSGQEVIWEVEKQFRNLDSASDIEFMRVFVSFAAKHLDPEREKREGKPITADEANKLTEDELEMIAGETIKRHIYLFEDRGKTDGEQGVSEKGEKLTSAAPVLLDIPKEETESNVHYLRRLIVLLSEREEIAHENRLKLISKTLEQFSASNSRIMEDLKESLNFTPRIIGLPPNPQHKTNEILNDVLENLVHQKEFNKASVESIRGTTTSVERIERRVENWEKKFDENITKSGKQSTINIWIQVIVGLLALLALIVSYMSYQVSLKNQSVEPPVTAPAPPETPQGLER
jgi:hypothetical protein